MYNQGEEGFSKLDDEILFLMKAKLVVFWKEDFGVLLFLTSHRLDLEDGAL